jgi:hypothetical protein
LLSGFWRYALQTLVSLDSPTIARAAAGLAAIAATAVFCPKILFMALNIVSIFAKVKSYFVMPASCGERSRTKAGIFIS